MCRVYRLIIAEVLCRDCAMIWISVRPFSASVVISPARRLWALEGVDLAEIAITSSISVSDGPAPDGAFTLADVADVSVVVGSAAGVKCERCWRVLPEVGDDGDYPDVCARCADAVSQAESSAE